MVSQAFRAANARPRPDFETMNRLFHPDHVLVSLMSSLGHGELKGIDGYREFLRESATTQPWTSEVEGAVDVGNGRVLVVTTVHWRSVASDAAMDTRAWTVATVQDDRVIRTEVYSHPAEALRAASRRDD